MRDGRPLATVQLDIGYYQFIRVVSAIPHPKRHPHEKTVYSLRVRAVRPDGSAIKPFAAVAFVNGREPPAALGFWGLGAEELPVGTEIELLGYEPHAA